MAESQCPFCKKSAAEERDRVGKTFRKDGVMVHQYCLYFAAGLHQRGEESEGVQGFLLSDIRKEVIRASKLTCKFCHQKGAATGCVVKSCRQTCHVPCGMENGFLLQHQGRFEAFCPVHRPRQKTLLVEAALLKNQTCPACLLEIGKNWRDQFNMLVCPVCETGIHRSCVQQQAWLAGLDFCSCSTCSNRELFFQEMLEMGVEIPEYDTDDQKEEPCKAENCLCPDGRTFYTRASKYRLKCCQSCEKSLGHLVCVKGQLCTACKSKTPASDSRSGAPPTSNGHAHKVGGSAESESSSPIVVLCDCLICKAKAESLPLATHSSDSHLSSPPPSGTTPPPLPSTHPSSLPCSVNSIPTSTTTSVPTSSTSSLPPSHSSTSSSSPSPPCISPPSYTMTSTAPSLSVSQPTPPQPTSSLLSPSLSPHPPSFPSTSTTIATSTVTPIPPPKRGLTPAEMFQIAASLPLLSSPGSPLPLFSSPPAPLISPPMIVESPVTLSSLLHSSRNPPTTSISVAENRRVAVRRPPPPPSFPFLPLHPHHLLCSHIRTALLAAALARPPLSHPSLQPRPPTPTSPRRILPNPHQLLSRLSFYHHHLQQQQQQRQIKHLRHPFPFQQQQQPMPHPPRFNPIPTRPPTLPRSLASLQGKTSLITSSHKPRPAPPSNLCSLKKKSQPLHSDDVPICSYFEYVDDPSEMDLLPGSASPHTKATAKETSRTEGLSSGLSQVDANSSRVEKSQVVSANTTSNESSRNTQTKLEEKSKSLLSENLKARQNLKRKLSTYESDDAGIAKKPRNSSESVTLTSLLTREDVDTRQENQLLVSFPVGLLSEKSRKTLDRERVKRNDRLTAEFLNTRGLVAKTPCLVLHRVRY